MARKIISSLGILFISSCIIAIVANLGTIYQGFFQWPRITIYILKSILFFSAFLIVAKKFKFKPIYCLLVFVLSILLIDSTVFWDGQSLIPLRFPFETLFSIAGIVGGYLFFTNRKIFYFFTLIFALFSFLGHRIFIPSIIRFMEKRLTKSIVYTSPFGKGRVFTILNLPIALEDTMKIKCTLIEYYFVGCPPCEKKLKYLKRLHEKVNSSEFGIYLICDGSISTFDSFLKNAKKNSDQSFSFFYDREKLKEKIIHGSNFPHEIIINKDGKILSSQIGFNEETSELYLSENYNTIRAVLDN